MRRRHLLHIFHSTTSNVVVFRMTLTLLHRYYYYFTTGCCCFHLRKSKWILKSYGYSQGNCKYEMIPRQFRINQNIEPFHFNSRPRKYVSVLFHVYLKSKPFQTSEVKQTAKLEWTSILRLLKCNFLSFIEKISISMPQKGFLSCLKRTAYVEIRSKHELLNSYHWWLYSK